MLKIIFHYIGFVYMLIDFNGNLFMILNHGFQKSTFGILEIIWMSKIC